LPLPELLELELDELLPFFFFPGAASVKLWLATMTTRTTSCRRQQYRKVKSCILTRYSAAGENMVLLTKKYRRPA
jgi:hypothetical protein